jgi:hypothetical protein
MQGFWGFFLEKVHFSTNVPLALSWRGDAVGGKVENGEAWGLPDRDFPGKNLPL